MLGNKDGSLMDFLLEFIPMFRTEQCAFVLEDEDETLTCIGRVIDVEKEDISYDFTADVKSLGWLWVRAFNSPVIDTLKEKE